MDKERTSFNLISINEIKKAQNENEPKRLTYILKIIDAMTIYTLKYNMYFVVM